MTSQLAIFRGGPRIRPLLGSIEGGLSHRSQGSLVSGPQLRLAPQRARMTPLSTIQKKTLRVAAMKQRLRLATALLVFSVASSSASAAPCKPDVSFQDRISKKQTDKWEQVLTSTGFLKKALMDDDVTIFLMVGRYGDTNAVSVQIQKVEENLARAAFESRYHAAKGDQFAFGFKDGEPVAFVAAEVSNQAKADLFGKLVMSVVLAAHVSDKDLAAMRQALTSRQVDAVRIALSSGSVENAVDDKTGRKLMEKFECFYQFLENKGITLTASAGSQSQPSASSSPQVQPLPPSSGTQAPPMSGSPQTGSQPPAGFATDGPGASRNYAAAAPGRYLRRGSSEDYVELQPDGTFFTQQSGRGFHGTYTVQADIITLQMASGAANRSRFNGNTVTDPDGTVWEKAPDPKTPSIPIRPESQPPAPPPAPPTDPGLASRDHATSASAPGRYFQKNSSDTLELAHDGTCFFQQGGKTYRGTYKVQGDTVVVQANGTANTFRLNGDTLVTSTVWEKQAESPKAAAGQVTIDQIIQMVAAKLADDIIIMTIRHTHSKFDLDPETLIRLKTSGVSDAVIRAMTR